MDSLKILLIGCLVSCSTEFRLPVECDGWLIQCYQVLSQEALFNIIHSPSSITTHGSLSVDCSAETAAARQRCNATIPSRYCSIPLPVDGNVRMLAYLCDNSDVITSNADCWSDSRFLQKWAECNRMLTESYEAVKDCLQEETRTIPESVCSSSAVSVFSELPYMLLSAMESF
ncbi:uncharacterized protein LOC124274548 [Haliotis rubra]|uniref:uncharacterized protein LOC124274548 n=1 Tax=Haliotis rubra TaxID=36100 RepID=UPI001EE52419|nr:uncharacterized protein LOC124274548 [Haliotis rubra]